MVIRFSEGGKDAVTARVQKEEQEYLEAFKKEREAKDELDMMLGEKQERETAVSINNTTYCWCSPLIVFGI